MAWLQGRMTFEKPGACVPSQSGVVVSGQPQGEDFADHRYPRPPPNSMAARRPAKPAPTITAS
jgi:hypothetical protein